ncbi:MAG: uracil-DNA glycosylase, partial [Anaerolineae bacterium]|nr:uracil-DNA glycosylase [Anaerolineae bacterium]
MRHPKMKPTGSDSPIIYVLGEAPGAEEDAKGKQFIGKAGRTLRRRIPEKWLKDIRWNNCVRTRPPDNATPGMVELECCRPSVVKDIEETKPKAIFGFGNIPLQWVLSTATGITNWRGRRLPVNIGTHSCWFFPMYHPSYINRQQRKNYRNEEYSSEEEFVFALDIKCALEEIENN